MNSDEPDEPKGSRPVLRGAFGKVTDNPKLFGNSPGAYPTRLEYRRCW
jgi:hypothetical protein